MKIELRMENGEPIIFLPDDDTGKPNFIACYTENEQHSEAQRAYMRSLKKPSSDAEFLLCWQTLQRYAKHVVYTMKI
jgi:hypothetical protein